jgi:hypothetical protein
MTKQEIRTWNKAINSVLHTLDICLLNLPDHRGTLEVVRDELVGLLLEEPAAQAEANVPGANVPPSQTILPPLAKDFPDENKRSNSDED